MLVRLRMRVSTYDPFGEAFHEGVFTGNPGGWSGEEEPESLETFKQ